MEWHFLLFGFQALETGSSVVGQVSFKLAGYPTLALRVWFSCLHHQNVGITGVYHDWLVNGFKVHLLPLKSGASRSSGTTLFHLHNLNIPLSTYETLLMV